MVDEKHMVEEMVQDSPHPTPYGARLQKRQQQLAKSNSVKQKLTLIQSLQVLKAN